MGSSASIPEKVDAPSAKALAGAKWDEKQFEAAANEDGFVTRKQLAEAAAASGVKGRVKAAELAKKYDLIVIGGGPAGVAAAMNAAHLGRRALIVDKPKSPPDELTGVDVAFAGPTGLWSKALRDTALKLSVPTLRAQGLDDDVIWKQVVNKCVRLADRNAETQLAQLGRFKVGYLQGEATLTDTPGQLRVVPHGGSSDSAGEDGGEGGGGALALSYANVLVATGSSATRMGGIPFDGSRVHDSDTVNGLAYLPTSVVITGSGIIAVEYAEIFAKLGATVTMLVRSSCMSALSRVGLDGDVARMLLEGLAADGVRVLEGAAVDEFLAVPGRGRVAAGLREERAPLRLSLKGKGVEDWPEAERVLECDMYLAAMGRSANTGAALGLGAAGVALSERGRCIEVDAETLACKAAAAAPAGAEAGGGGGGGAGGLVEGLYAAGDVIGPPSLASTGVEQAQRAVACMFREAGVGAAHGPPKQFPIGMWTIPECAYFGLTKAAAEKQGMAVLEGTAPYDACLRGRVFAPHGLLKLVFRESDQVIVGVHLIGADACELIHYGMDLVKNAETIFDVIGTTYTAVTYHELFKEAALDGDSRLEYGMEWQQILAALASQVDAGGLLESGALREAFGRIDANGSGALDAEELLAMFAEIGHAEITVGHVANLVRLADTDGSGTIEWDEFERVFQAVHATKAKA